MTVYKGSAAQSELSQGSNTFAEAYKGNQLVFSSQKMYSVYISANRLNNVLNGNCNANEPGYEDSFRFYVNNNLVVKYTSTVSETDDILLGKFAEGSKLSIRFGYNWQVIPKPMIFSIKSKSDPSSPVNRVNVRTFIVKSDEELVNLVEFYTMENTSSPFDYLADDILIQ
jgi:hypothetical protein